MERWTSFLLRQRAAVLLLAAATLGLGFLAWRGLPVDAFPDVTNVQVMVLADAPGLTAADVESRVTYPIEQHLGGLPRVTQVRSLSRAELSQVVVVFEDGTDIFWARQIVFERIAGAREALPTGVEPELGPISTGLGEIYQYTLRGRGVDEAELRAVQDWMIAPRLRNIPGVNEVNVLGGKVRELHVVPRPERLVEYGIPLRQVVEALAANNANAPGSFVVRGWEQTYVRSVGLLGGKEDVERIVLRAQDGRPVFLRDVADVEFGTAPRQGAATRGGDGEVVAGAAIMLRGANSQETVERVKAAIPGIRRSLPPGVTLDPYYDRTELVDQVLETVQGALVQGALFVVLILLLLLGSLRTALVVVLALPLTFALAFMLMGWRGLTLNLMSVGGLSFAVGIVVDATIVVGENIQRHLDLRREGESRAATVARAVGEVGSPVFFSVLIVGTVLVPLLMLQGMEGKMFGPLAVTMILAVFASIAVALVAVPVLSDILVRARASREPLLLRGLRAAYRGVLGAALRLRWVLLPACLAALAAVAWLARDVGTEFMPALDEGAMAINVVRLPNAALDGSVAVSTHIERRLRAFPEIRTVVSRTGRAEISEDPMGPEQTDVLIMLHPREEWTTGRTREQLEAAIRLEVEAIPGIRAAFSQPIALRVNELISGVKSDLAIKVFGPDLERLRETADRVAAAVRGVEGAVDVKVEQVSGLTQLDVELDRAAAARHGINVADVNELIATAVGGATATALVEGERRTAVTVRFPEDARRDRAALERLLLEGAGGARVTLGSVAAIREVEGPALIGREAGMRRVNVEVNVRGRDLGGFVAEVRERLAPLEAELPPGTFIAYGGQFENQERAMARLAVVVPISLGLIAVFLFLALRSVRDVLLVVAVLPFAVAGGVIVMLATGTNLSVSTAVAFILLFGIAVENAVVLVAFFRQLHNEGREAMDAVKTGCDLRLRPLLLTSLTTLLGALPLAYATGPGAEIQRPVALVVLGGLASSLLVTLIVLPAAWAITTPRRRKPAVEDGALESPAPEG
ncbi:MAG: efflux RND transporter permease subunit [Deltaproteobacteria bacterium]|nr:efflux RND transporter permease subunit [Deltaproteobacteria bacterium]